MHILFYKSSMCALNSGLLVACFHNETQKHNRTQAYSISWLIGCVKNVSFWQKLPTTKDVCLSVWWNPPPAWKENVLTACAQSLHQTLSTRFHHNTSHVTDCGTFDRRPLLHAVSPVRETDGGAASAQHSTASVKHTLHMKCSSGSSLTNISNTLTRPTVSAQRLWLISYELHSKCLSL